MACSYIAEASALIHETLPTIDWIRHWTALGATFTLVVVAELGDKSQIVCMMLASRHRHWPVLWGSVLAFALLNAMAVAFGAAAGHWLPERYVALAVAILFMFFGIRNLLARHEDDDETVVKTPGHGVFVTTFLMIFLAELGDKTQIAVAGLSTAQPPVDVWLGATLALVMSSALGIWAGRALLRRVHPRTVSVVSGMLFLIFAGYAFWRAIPPDFLKSLPERVMSGNRILIRDLR